MTRLSLARRMTALGAVERLLETDADDSAVRAVLAGMNASLSFTGGAHVLRLAGVGASCTFNNGRVLASAWARACRARISREIGHEI